MVLVATENRLMRVPTFPEPGTLPRPFLPGYGGHSWDPLPGFLATAEAIRS
jgi:hypothetical protein